MVTVHLNGHAVEHTFTADELFDARVHWSQFGEVTYTVHRTIIANGVVPLSVRLVHGPGERHPRIA